MSGGKTAPILIPMEVIFVRHGHAESNVYHPDNIVGSDLGLTPEGIRQAEATGAHLAKLALQGAIGPIDNPIFTSPYIRARQTAEIIARHLQHSVMVDYRLKEIQKGDWHGMKVDDVMRLEEGVQDHERHSFRPPSSDTSTPGENWFDVADRMTDFIIEAKENGYKSLLLVSHNHPIEIAAGKLRGLDVTEWKDNPIDNAALLRMTEKDDI